MKSNITVLIPMRNEIKHIERSVRSALRLTDFVYVVDSDSNDGSKELAESLGAKVFQYNWTAESNFSKKINWALNELPVQTDWIFRLDADEYFLDETIEGLNAYVSQLPDDVYGGTVVRRIFFMGRWMRHSGEYPKTSLRLFRKGKCTMESRWLDEHVDIGDGRAVDLPFDVVDDNHISLMQWVNKHNSDYSNKEALELINGEIGLFERSEGVLDANAQKKKNIKQRYASMPHYWRCFVWFFYRQFIKLGFLDGREGFLWNFFQGLWYRILADAKVDEIYRACGKDKEKIRQYFLENYSIDITKG